MIQNNRQFTELLENLRNNSCFLQKIDSALSFLKGKGGSFFRTLNDGEIEQLHRQGNRATDWREIQVSEGFNPDTIFGSHFIGRCSLGGYGRRTESGTPKTGSPHAGRLEPGIYNSVVSNSVIGADTLVYGNSRLESVFTEEGVTIFNSSLIGYGPAAAIAKKEGPREINDGREHPFGIGVFCTPGLEAGGTGLPLYPDLTWESACFLLENIEDSRVYRIFSDYVNCYKDTAKQFSCCFLGEDAVIENCMWVYDCFISSRSSVSGVLELSKTTLLSDGSEPVVLGSGVICRESIVKRGSCIDSGALIEGCAVLESSHIDKHAKGSKSILGPDIGFSEGEITASFAGPLTGFHHQALLISAYWPYGKGNVAYGANVGSNHTSRMPDQEILPGEGMFFGLGCSIKFPANFKKAPFSVIATGVVTMPQKMEFPFSCIVPPEGKRKRVPPGYNRLLPAWCLHSNLYMCIRGNYKYRSRSSGHWDSDFLSVFRSKVMEYVIDAREVLLGHLHDWDATDLPEDFVYTDETIPELGKNYVYPRDLRRALEAYTFILEYYFGEQWYALICKESEKRRPGDIVPDLNDSVAERIRSLLFEDEVSHRAAARSFDRVLSKVLELTISAREKDERLGMSVIDTYSVTHQPLAEDPVIDRLKHEISGVKVKIEHYLF